MKDDQIELAARHACKLLGLDPDDNIPERGRDGFYLQTWEVIAPKVREQWAILRGILNVIGDDLADGLPDEATARLAKGGRG